LGNATSTREGGKPPLVERVSATFTAYEVTSPLVTVSEINEAYEEYLHPDCSEDVRRLCLAVMFTSIVPLTFSNLDFTEEEIDILDRIDKDTGFTANFEPKVAPYAESFLLRQHHPFIKPEQDLLRMQVFMLAYLWKFPGIQLGVQQGDHCWQNPETFFNLVSTVEDQYFQSIVRGLPVSLNFTQNLVTDETLFRAIACFSNTHYLSLPSGPLCRLTDNGLSEIEKLPNLEYLNLYLNDNITSEGFDSLNKLTQVKTLILSGWAETIKGFLSYQG